MLYLHVIAESSIGSKQDLALFINTIVHAWQLRRKPDLVTAPGVCVEQTSTGFGPVWKAHKTINIVCLSGDSFIFFSLFILNPYEEMCMQHGRLKQCSLLKHI